MGKPLALSHADIQAALDAKTKPPGSLGRIEVLAAQLAAIGKTLKPRFATCRLLLFAADHGLANAGVSAYPQTVTRQMVLNFLAGGAAANAFANAVDVALSTIDAGICGDAIVSNQLIQRRCGEGTANSLLGPAMTEKQYAEALGHGKTLAQNATEDAIAIGEMGIGNTASATLLYHKILGLDLDEVTGPGTGLSLDGLTKKREILRKASNRTSERLSAADAAREYGGFEIVMMAGAILGAQTAQKPVLVDGFIATAAAAIAHELNAACADVMIFAHCSAEPGHQQALDALNAQPLLQLNMRLGEGTGALLAWPLVKSAASMMRDMATFDSAGVSGKAGQ